MRLGLSKNKDAIIENDIVLFLCSVPSIIQPAEIQRVQTGITVKIERGYVLNIYTSSELTNRAGEIFPATIILDYTSTGELRLPVRNNGRNPLHIMVGDKIARGYVIEIQKIIPYEFEPDTEPDKPLPRTKPQKKNTPFQFEIN